MDGLRYPDGVSFWDKQDAIHQATHVHGGPAFVPWHREMCNRFEALLQQVDPTVSLHYWGWTTDPRHSPDRAGGFTDLFTQAFMGSASGRAGGVPLQVPGAAGGMIHGHFAVPPGCYLVRAAASCHNVVTDWAWVDVGCGATVCVDLVPPTVRHCVERALTGITLGTVDHEHHVHDLAPREARTATNALKRLAGRLPADPLPAPPQQQGR